jgi:trypsin
MLAVLPISFVQVSVAFTFGTGVQPIALTRAAPAAGDRAVVSGWGKVSSGSATLPDHLQAVTVLAVPAAQCESAYATYGGITENMICAAVTGGGKDACQGDSGGPLVAGGTLVGIVSWGVGCAEARYPGVYSNVAALRDFVSNVTGVN